MVAAFVRTEGTGAFEGQLYETKSVSLFLFRLLHDPNVEEFSLASNYNDIGKFDDICLKVKLVGRDRPILILIQAKHKEQKDNETKDLEYPHLIPHFLDGLAKVKNKFLTKKDEFFSGEFRETDCMFILYTNASHVKSFTKTNSDSNDNNQDIHNIIETGNSSNSNDYKQDIHKIIGTGKVAKVNYNEKIKEYEAIQLVEHFAPFLTTKADAAMNIMGDPYMLRYHAYLAQHILEFSEVSRLWEFRDSFFDTKSNDNIISLFRVKLLEIIFIHQLMKTMKDAASEPDSSDTDEKLKLNTTKFISDPCESTLRLLIKKYDVEEIDPKDKKKKEIFYSIVKRPNVDVEKIKAAERKFAEAILRNYKLTFPITFGNVDLILKKKSRVQHLAKVISEWCEKSTINERYRIVTLDKSVEQGMIKADGGIGSAIGNLFVYDEETKYLMFTKDQTSLKENAGALFEQLRENLEKKLKIKDDELKEYINSIRFNVKAIKDFPLLTFDFTEEAKLLHIYYKQGNQRKLEDLLVQAIDEQRSIKRDNSSVKTETIFLHFHDEIQKWSQLKKAPYFEKTSDIYERTVNNIEKELQMSNAYNAFYTNNKTYFRYDFIGDALQPLKPIEELARTIVVTDIAILTTVKIIRCLQENNKSYSVVDLLHTIGGADDDRAFTKLIAELNNTNKVPIIICDIIKNPDSVRNRLDQLEQTNMKKAIVITNKGFLETAQKYFAEDKYEVIYDDNQSLCDLTPEFQQHIKETVEVLFQGNKVTLETLVDNDSNKLIRGDVFKKILAEVSKPTEVEKPIEIGTSPDTRKDEDDIGKSFYIDRSVRLVSNDQSQTPSILLNKFQDIKDRIVIITAEPGMGKSTLLDHLAVNGTNSSVWIVKLNFVDLTSILQEWADKKKTPSIEDVIACCCLHALMHIYASKGNKEGKGKKLKIKLAMDEGEIVVSQAADEEALFEISLFLHFYKNCRIIFLLDGFDEVCPDYNKQAVAFIDALKNNKYKNNVWITSRPYNEILRELDSVSGKSYTLESFTHEDQKKYLENYWQAQRIDRLATISVEQINKLIEVIQTTEINKDYRTVCYYFCDFLQKQPLGTTCNQYPNEQFDMLLINEQSVTPLILFLIADYFVNFCEEFDTSIFSTDFNLINMYKSFIESKIKRNYIAKLKIDLSIPKNKSMFAKVLEEYVYNYRKIAAYSFFNRFLSNDRLIINEYSKLPLKMRDFEDCTSLIEEIASPSEDLAGLISHVSPNNVSYVHLTFTEYLAAEYVCDILTKNNDFDCVECLYIALYIHHNNFVSKWIREKKRVDENLNRIICEIKRGIPYQQVRRIVQCNVQ